MVLTDSEIARFWQKVKISDDISCWEWTASKRHFGYGQINIRRYPFKAHRLSWIIHFGVIPNGFCVCHRCDNPGCVNPSHLFLGTQTDNMTDMNRKLRHGGPKGESHPSAKLTNAQVAEIRTLLTSLSCRRIAKLYRVSHTAIICIKNHVTRVFHPLLV
jgi:hypothetical protein